MSSVVTCRPIPVFELDNRGKRAIALDLSTERGLDLAHQLVADADVFLTNLRPAALERIGLGPDQVHERHPASSTPSSPATAWRDPTRSGAPTTSPPSGRVPGIAESLRAPGGALPFQRGGMGDHSAAMTGAAMISAALVEHARTGRGQVVSTSLLRQGCYTIGFDLNVMLMWGRSLNVGIRETMYSPDAEQLHGGGRPRLLDRRPRGRPPLAGPGSRRRAPRVAHRRALCHRHRPGDQRRRADRTPRRDLRHPPPRRVGRSLRRRAGSLLEPGQLHRGRDGRRAVPGGQPVPS